MYGERCHFRHDYRNFSKIHRHFYIAHAAALRLTAEEILLQSKYMPDGDEFDFSEYNDDKEVFSANGHRPRLSCFAAVATEETQIQCSETDSTSGKSERSDDQAKVGELDMDALLNDSF